MTEHNTPAPDRFERAKEILDAVNAEFPGYKLGWNSGRPWLELADAQDYDVKLAIRIGALRSENQRLARERDDAQRSLEAVRRELADYLTQAVSSDTSNTSESSMPLDPRTWKPRSAT